MCVQASSFSSPWVPGAGVRITIILVQYCTYTVHGVCTAIGMDASVYCTRCTAIGMDPSVYCTRCTAIGMDASVLYCTRCTAIGMDASVLQF